MLSVVRRLFDVPASEDVMVVAGPVLRDSSRVEQLTQWIRGGGRGFVYLQNRLGGEITLSATSRSPEFSFDSTVVQIVERDGGFDVHRYGILEVQTMDFHGSYRAAVTNLRDALRLHGDSFPDVLQANLSWTAEKVEGPNISNVFKRTFYQMMFKFQVGAHEHCAGTALAIPRAVWDSWQRHLGGPDLVDRGDGSWSLLTPHRGAIEGSAPGWIYVFDVDASSDLSPNPLLLDKLIATNASAMSYYALNVAPEAALGAGGSADRLLASIRSRITRWWPEMRSC